MNNSQYQDVFLTHSQKMRLLAFLPTEMTEFPTLSYTSANIPEAWKRYPFRAEPPRIGEYRDYLPPLGPHFDVVKWSVPDNELTLVCACLACSMK